MRGKGGVGGMVPESVKSATVKRSEAGAKRSVLSKYLVDASELPFFITRDEFSSQLMTYIEPLINRFINQSARIEIAGAGVSYELDTVSMEAFARPLWGLAPFWAGGGSHGELEGLYGRGLAAGTDPDCVEYWGDCRDYDQKFVEMAAIAYGLLLAPHVLWEPLSASERQNVASWLGQINAHKVWENNWLYFPVLVNLALKHLGMPYSEETIQANLDLVETFYRGDGWYTDGASEGVNGLLDYYNPYALHFYGLVYALIAQREDPVRAERFVRRAAKFASEYLLLFSQRGESVPWGRSLTYRFAQCAFFSIALAVRQKGLPGAEELPDAATMKGVVARNLALWAQLPCTDNGGVLTVGYHYPCLTMGERYNAPGSPLWACKAFALLLLPEDDALWKVSSAPLAQADGVYPIAGGEMLVRRFAGEATLYPVGRRGSLKFAHMPAKYSKFAYSTRWGFSTPVSMYSLAEAAPDSTMAFVVNDIVYVRARVDAAAFDGASITSTWSPLPGIRVTTTIMPTAWGHRREHVIESQVDCEAYDCGFAVPAESSDQAAGICGVASGEGGAAGEPVCFKAAPNTNLMCPKTFIHAMRYRVPVGTTRVVTDVLES